MLTKFKVIAPHILRPFQEQYPRLSRWIARWGGAGLLVTAVCFEEAHEYFVALVLVFGSAISLVASLIHWEGVAESPSLTKMGRVAGLGMAIILLTISAVWIFGRKGNQDWSRIPQAWTQVLYWIGVPPLTPPGIPGPGDEVTLAPIPPADMVYVPANPQPNSPWRVYLGTALIRHPQGFEAGPYATDVIGCESLVAVDYLTHMRIVNQTDKPRGIQAYSIEARSFDGKWRFLKRLLFAPDKKLYFLHELGLQLSEMRGLHLLNDAIQRSFINPHDSVSGFALFSYTDSSQDIIFPVKINSSEGLFVAQFSILNVRINIQDSTGIPTQTFPYIETGKSDLTMHFVLSKPIDYEGFQFHTFEHACK